MLYRLITFLAFILCSSVFKIKVYGKNNIPPESGFILASNHVSFLDPVVLAVATPRKLSFLAREELFTFNRVFSWLIRSSGAIPLSRESVDFGALRKAIQVLEQNQALLIFPEGKRSLDGRLQPGLPGIGFLAAKTGTPIVPVYIKGSNKALPPGAKFIRLAKIKVLFGKGITPAEVGADSTRNTYELIANKVMQEIAQLKRILDEKS